MTATDEGIATETTGPTQAETNFKSFESAFEKHTADPQPSGVLENNASDGVPQPKQEKAPEVVKEAAPTEEPEFPAEMMGGEKPKVEPVKDELDDIQPSAKMGQESRQNFDKLKSIARTAKEEAARVKAEFEAHKAKPAVMADSEALKQAHDRIKEMEATLERSNFTMSPKYKAIVTEKNQAIEDAKQYLEGTEIDKSVIDLAARLTGPKRVAALRDAGLDAETIASISPFLAHADRKERESATALEQSTSLRQEWEAEQRRRGAQATGKGRRGSGVFRSGRESRSGLCPFSESCWRGEVERPSRTAERRGQGVLQRLAAHRHDGRDCLLRCRREGRGQNESGTQVAVNCAPRRECEAQSSTAGRRWSTTDGRGSTESADQSSRVSGPHGTGVRPRDGPRFLTAAVWQIGRESPALSGS